MPEKLGYTVNFRAKPFGNNYDYPEFLSSIYQYVDKVDLYELSLPFENSFIQVYVNNYTNSISKIDIEIKHSDNNLILTRQTVHLKEGENKITLPLGEIKKEALKTSREFVLSLNPLLILRMKVCFKYMVLRLFVIHNILKLGSVANEQIQ